MVLCRRTLVNSTFSVYNTTQPSITLFYAQMKWGISIKQHLETSESSFVIFTPWGESRFTTCGGNAVWKGLCSDERAESARYLLWKRIGIFARTEGKAPSLIKGPRCVVTHQAWKLFCWYFKRLDSGKQISQDNLLNLNGITEWGLNKNVLFHPSGPYKVNIKFFCCKMFGNICLSGLFSAVCFLRYWNSNRTGSR